MPLFSERMGLTPGKSAIQVDSMDDDLRTGLWNALQTFYWDAVASQSPQLHGWPDTFATYVRLVWSKYFKDGFDTIPGDYRQVLVRFRDYFFSPCQWFEVYDFIEFTAQNYPQPTGSTIKRGFIRTCNSVLKRELSAYRFVSGRIAPLTSAEEIQEVEEALDLGGPLKPVRDQLARALDLFADRKDPDYRNSIKESISAVEAMCRLVTGQPKATLGEALKRIGEKVPLHGALKNAFESLYGWTSDEGGIRHALQGESTLGSEDAKFMLVACSAFVNFLVAKAAKSGIKL